MSKVIMTLHLPDPKVRKKTAKAVQSFKDKSKYCRKAKHKGPWAETHGPFLFLQIAHGNAMLFGKGNLLFHAV
jgi:hypothetical protein